jgi:hypothetical protein
LNTLIDKALCCLTIFIFSTTLTKMLLIEVLFQEWQNRKTLAVALFLSTLAFYFLVCQTAFYSNG